MEGVNLSDVKTLFDELNSNLESLKDIFNNGIDNNSKENSVERQNLKRN